MWAGIVGVLAGIATLFFAWRAAHWAKDAATHAKTGATAALDSLSVATDEFVQNRSGLRAWITVKECQVFPVVGIDGSLDFSICVEWENCGSTPAIDVAVYGGFEFALTDQTVKDIDQAKNLRNAFGPNQVKRSFPVVIDWEEAHRERKTYNYRSVVHYRDIFDKKIRHSTATFAITYQDHRNPENFNESDFKRTLFRIQGLQADID